MKQVIWALSLQATGPRGCDFWAHIQSMGMTQRIRRYWSNRASKQTNNTERKPESSGEVSTDCPVRAEPGKAALDGWAQREGATVGIASQETMNNSVSRIKMRKNGAERESYQSRCKRNGEMHTCPSRAKEAKPTYWTEYCIKTDSADIRRNGRGKRWRSEEKQEKQQDKWSLSNENRQLSSLRGQS